jgi:hypothetical protein
MNTILALTLLVAGLACLVCFRSLGRLFAGFMAERFHESYGQYASEHGWDNPISTFNKYFYRSIIIFLGLFLLIMSFTVYFGPIHLNG